MHGHNVIELVKRNVTFTVSDSNSVQDVEITFLCSIKTGPQPTGHMHPLYISRNIW